LVDIVIANNNKITGEGLKTILQSKTGNRILGVVSSLEELTKKANRYSPNIIVMDFSCSSFGLKSIKEIKKLYKGCKILAITDKLPKSTMYAALKNGVDSYLLSDCQPPEIMEAIADTFEGKQFYCGEVIDILSDEDKDKNGCSGVSLSQREIEVIRLISDGYSNKEIAEKIFLSTHTVNTHRKNIMNKLGIKNTAGIVIYAFRQNIIQ
jgi:DNA-binding NarL/FixJ family response regulator